MDCQFQRDALFVRIQDRVRQGLDIVIVAADMAAPALDSFRKEYPTRFVNVGIAEQNAVQVAAGLALNGKTVFVYAISPFITLRCFEQLRVSCGIMDIPLTIVGMGTGLGYCTDGPTHHLIEDVTVLRALPNFTIYCLTDNVMAAAAVDLCCQSSTPTYLRLDKDPADNLYDSDHDFTAGFHAFDPNAEDLLLTTAPMTHVAMQLAKGELSDCNLGLVDVYRLPLSDAFAERLASARRVITLEEHFLPGAMGGAVCELLCDRGRHIPILRLGLSGRNGYQPSYVYGGRDLIREAYGIGTEQVVSRIRQFLA